MVDFIKGRVEEIGLDYLIMSVGGIGYRINASTLCLNNYSLFEEDMIYTKLLVKEDDISIIGFANLEEREMYNLLTRVSKIGMKMALSLLSAYSVSDIAYFIKKADSNSISKVSGYGKKTAERLILELKDKVDNFLFNVDIEEGEKKVSSNLAINKTFQDAVDGLTILGFNKREADYAVSKAIESSEQAEDVSTIIKRALGFLKR